MLDQELINIFLEIDVKDAAKKFGKKFACGASVIDDNAIEIQGDIAMELIEYITEQFPNVIININNFY